MSELGFVQWDIVALKHVTCALKQVYLTGLFGRYKRYKMING